MESPEPFSDSTRRFSNRVEHYIRARPGYPPALIRFCQERLGLLPEHFIADIGSGTGILTSLLLENGNRVFAVEPNTEMRAAAEQLLRGFPRFTSINGTAENTGLETSRFDFIVAGQAFHWFDRRLCRKEFARILRPGGWVILVWNDRIVTPESFSAAYERIINHYAVDLGRVKHQNITATDCKVLADFFAPENYSTATFENVHNLDFAGVSARAFSSSYLPLPGQPRCQEMLDDLRHEFEKHQHGNQVVQLYETKMYYGQLSANVIDCQESK